MLNADAQAYRSRADAGGHLLRGRHLPVGGRGRMAGQGLGIAEVDEALEELQRVVKAHAGGHAAVDFKRHQ